MVYPPHRSMSTGYQSAWGNVIPQVGYLCSKQIEFLGAPYCLELAVRVEFAVDILDMLARRFDGNDQSFCDVVTRQTVSEQAQYLQFTLAQLLCQQFAAPLRSRRRNLRAHT